MIDIIKQTPSEYSKQSRDYQIIARLYSALFNISKSYIDSMSIWDNNIDNNLTELRAKTLNFQTKHTWSLDDLEAVTSCFKYLMFYKGTRKALEYCISILMKIEKIGGDIDENTIIIDDNNLIIRLEEGLITWGVLEDLMKYLLPAGFTYRIIRYKSKKLNTISDKFLYEDNNIYIRKFGWDEDMFTIGGNDVDSEGNNSHIINNTFVYTDTYSSEATSEEEIINWDMEEL